MSHDNHHASGNLVLRQTDERVRKFITTVNYLSVESADRMFVLQNAIALGLMKFINPTPNDPAVLELNIDTLAKAKNVVSAINEVLFIDCDEVYEYFKRYAYVQMAVSSREIPSLAAFENPDFWSSFAKAKCQFSKEQIEKQNTYYREIFSTARVVFDLLEVFAKEQ